MARGIETARNDTPQKLLNVAIELFASGGFKATSIRDIARLTGMTISTIYYYFGSKDGLLLAILERSAEGLVNVLREVTRKDLGPLERFKLLVTTHLNLVGVHWKEVRIFFLDDKGELPAASDGISKQFQRDVLKVYKKELLRLRRAGLIKYENLTVLAFNILGIINWHLWWYKPGGKLSIEQVHQEILSFVLHGALADCS